MSAQLTGVISPEELSYQTTLRTLLPEAFWKVMDDRRVTDIDCDEYGRIWAKFDGKKYDFVCEISASIAHSVASTLSAWEALAFDVDRRQSIKTTWPGYGFRTIVKIPPAVNPLPTFHVRTQYGSDLTLRDLVEVRTLTATQALHVENEWRSGRTTIIAGYPGAGKTTTQRAGTQILATVPWLVYIVDPLDEIDVKRAPNLRKVKPNKGYTTIQALDDALLCDPGAVAYGEVRTGEDGVNLIRTWLAVGGPYCTCHCEGFDGVIPRFADFYREQKLEPVYGDLARVIHNVIYMRKYVTDFGSRYVGEVVTVSTTTPTPKSPADFIYTKID